MLSHHHACHPVRQLSTHRQGAAQVFGGPDRRQWQQWVDPTTVLVRKDRVIVANVGDSRAVMCRVESRLTSALSTECTAAAPWWTPRSRECKLLEAGWTTAGFAASWR